MEVYPLVNVYITMGNHHNLMGKFTISMVIFHSYVTNYQRVSQLRAVTSSSQAHQGREGMEWRWQKLCGSWDSDLRIFERWICKHMVQYLHFRILKFPLIGYLTDDQ